MKNQQQITYEFGDKAGILDNLLASNIERRIDSKGRINFRFHGWIHNYMTGMKTWGLITYIYIYPKPDFKFN